MPLATATDAERSPRGRYDATLVVTGRTAHPGPSDGHLARDPAALDVGPRQADTGCMPAATGSKWSWLYAWILLWMASLTIPTIASWQSALARDRGVETDPNAGWGVVIALALATMVLGFAIGWHRRWTAVWIAAGLGALVMSVGVWVDYNHGWSGGEPMPEPAPFLMNLVILGILLWTGAGMGAMAFTARQRRSRPWKPAT